MFTRTFLRVFPPPAYLEMRHGGIDISDDAVRVVEYERIGKIKTIHSWNEYFLPAGVVESGTIRDEAALVKILEKVRSHMHSPFVHAALPEERMYLFRTDVPNGTRDEMRQAIEAKLEENVPLSPTDVIFEFDVMDQRPGQVDASTVSVSVVPYEVMNTYLSALSKAGFKVSAFEVEAHAVKRATVPDAVAKTYVVVHIRGAKTGIYVVSHGVVCFTSTVSVGGAMIDLAIKKNFSLEDDKVRAFKNEHAYDESAEAQEIFNCSMNTLSTIRDEVARVVQYWRNHNDSSHDIGGVIMCGKDSMIYGLTNYMSTGVGLPVEVTSVWGRIAHEGYIPPLTRVESLDYIVAAGLAY